MAKQLDYSLLTTNQRDLIRDVVKWYKNPDEQIYAYSGAPGVGKTFVIPYIIDSLYLSWDEIIFCAFTGKAASNLCKKGLPAATIHSTFYELIEVPRKDKNGDLIYVNGRVRTDLKFREKNFIDPRVRLIVIDEWSMINTELANAMTKHKIPILAAGDADQLEPITGISPFKKYVRFYLTEIMRQAKDSGIIMLASLLREGKPLPYHYTNFNNDAYVMSSDFLSDKKLKNADIILTTKNKTRNKYNNKLRDLNGFKGKLPEVGERLICRRNAWNKCINGIPLINGTTGTVISPIMLSDCNLSKGIYRCDFKPDFVDDDYFDYLMCDYDFLTQPAGEKEIDQFNPGIKLEFGYSQTVFSSQGSEYDNVIYIDEFVGTSESMRKVRYTACTRAKSKFYFIYEKE